METGGKQNSMKHPSEKTLGIRKGTKCSSSVTRAVADATNAGWMHRMQSWASGSADVPMDYVCISSRRCKKVETRLETVKIPNVPSRQESC